jgi:hypothetical protein
MRCLGRGPCRPSLGTLVHPPHDRRYSSYQGFSSTPSASQHSQGIVAMLYLLLPDPDEASTHSCRCQSLQSEAISAQ